MKMKKGLLLAAVLLVSALPSFAQLQVIDPASIKQQIQQLISMNKQLVQLQQMYALYQQMHALQSAEAQSLRDLQSRYRYTFTNWQQFAVGNQYGNTNLWANGINSGNTSAIQNGYRSLVPVVQPVDVTLTPEGQQDWRQQYGLLQLQDATLMAGIKTSGDIRTNIQQNSTTLKQLESDAMSADPNLTSAKAVQQKTLVALLLMIRTLQDTNRALESSLDMQAQVLAQQRWERGRTLNAGAADRKALGN